MSGDSEANRERSHAGRVSDSYSKADGPGNTLPRADANSSSRELIRTECVRIN